MTNLLPCPFCNCHTISITTTTILYDNGLHSIPPFPITVRCNNCPATIHSHSREHAINAWNARAHTPLMTKSEPKSEPADTYPHEYRTLALSPSYPADDLNYLSNQGWELVAVDNHTAFLRRPAEDVAHMKHSTEPTDA